MTTPDLPALTSAAHVMGAILSDITKLTDMVQTYRAELADASADHQEAMAMLGRAGVPWADDQKQAGVQLTLCQRIGWLAELVGKQNAEFGKLVNENLKLLKDVGESRSRGWTGAIVGGGSGGGIGGGSGSAIGALTAMPRSWPAAVQTPSMPAPETYLQSEDFMDIVFDGPPGHESGRFVEVEDQSGHSISVGEWRDRGDGLWALRIHRDSRPAAPDLQPLVDPQETLIRQLTAKLDEITASAQWVGGADLLIKERDQKHQEATQLRVLVAKLEADVLEATQNYQALKAARSRDAEQAASDTEARIKAEAETQRIRARSRSVEQDREQAEDDADASSKIITRLTKQLEIETNLVEQRSLDLARANERIAKLEDEIQSLKATPIAEVMSAALAKSQDSVTSLSDESRVFKSRIKNMHCGLAIAMRRDVSPDKDSYGLPLPAPWDAMVADVAALVAGTPMTATAAASALERSVADAENAFNTGDRKTKIEMIRCSIDEFSSALSQALGRIV
jgi:hypothetical protein